MKNKINNEHIIRTIKLIGSRFFIKKAGQVVTVFAPPWRDFVSASRRILNFCSCTQDRFVMEDKPGQCHCNTINFVTGDKYIVRIKIVPLTLTFDSVRAFGVTVSRLKCQYAARCSRRVTLTNYTAGPSGKICNLLGLFGNEKTFNPTKPD